MAELNRERSEIGTDHLPSVSPEFSLYTYLAGPLRDQVGVGDGLDDPHCTPAGESFPRTSDKGVSTVKFLLVGERGFLLVLLLSFSLSLFLSFLYFFLSFFLSFLFLPFTFTYSFPPFCLRLIVLLLFSFWTSQFFVCFVLSLFFIYFLLKRYPIRREHLGAAATPRQDLPPGARFVQWPGMGARTSPKIPNKIKKKPTSSFFLPSFVSFLEPSPGTEKLHGHPREYQKDDGRSAPGLRSVSEMFTLDELKFVDVFLPRSTPSSRLAGQQGRVRGPLCWLQEEGPRASGPFKSRLT